jgi:hypothetical protein
MEKQKEKREEKRGDKRKGAVVYDPVGVPHYGA